MRGEVIKQLFTDIPESNKRLRDITAHNTHRKIECNTISRNATYKFHFVYQIYKIVWDTQGDFLNRLFPINRVLSQPHRFVGQGQNKYFKY